MPKERALFVVGYLVIALILGVLVVSGNLRISPMHSGQSETSTQSQELSQIVYIYNSTTVQLVPPTMAGTLNMLEPFNLSTTSLVQGAFVSDHGVQMFVVPKSEIFNYSSSYTYTTGNVSSGRISVALDPGSYYFVIIDPVSVATNITITEPIEAVPV